MSYPRNSGIDRRKLADEIDALDAQIKTLNDSKSETYKDFREKLEGQGMEPRRASAEVAATKAAIARRRKLKADPAAVREKDDLIDEILSEIMRPSRAREDGHEVPPADDSTQSAATSGDADAQGVAAPPSTAARMDVRQGRAGEEVTPAPLTQQGFATPDSLGNEVGRPESATLQSEASDRVAPPSAGTLEAAGTQAPPVDTHPEPVEGAQAGAAGVASTDAQSSGAAEGNEAEAAAPATPLRKNWKWTDPAHPDCLDPGTCGGFSNMALCGRCKEAAGGVERANFTAAELDKPLADRLMT